MYCHVQRIPIAFTVTIMLSLALLIGCASSPLSSAPEPVTLHFGYREYVVEMEPLIEAFREEYPHITIEPVEVERYGNEIESLVRSGELDIFREDRSALGFAKEDLIRPLDEVQLSDWADTRDDYLSGSWEALSIAGQQWGIPASVDVLVVYANSDHMRAVGVEPPQTPWSLFEFLELANQLNYPEGTPYDPSTSVFGLCTTPADIDPIIFIYLQGGQIVDDLNNPTMATLDAPRTVEAVQWYADLYNRYGVASDPEVISRVFRQGGIYEAAVRGRCGLWLGWYGNRGGLDSAYEWQSSWTMLPLPSDQTDFGLGDVEGYYVASSCEHPKEALTFLRFLANEWQASGKRLPPRGSLATSDGYIQSVGDNAGDVTANIEETFPRQMIIMPQLGLGKTDELEFVGEQLIGAIMQIINQDLDAEQVLEETQYRARGTFSAQ